MKRIALWCVAFLVMTVASAHAANVMAKVAAFRGEVKISRSGKHAMVKVKNYPLYAGDTIVTTENGIARVVYADGSYVDVRRNSEVVMRTGALDIKAGDITADIKTGSTILRKFNTPSGVAAVKGTKLSVIVDADGRMTVTCDHGMVAVADATGQTTMDIGPGQRIQLTPLQGQQGVLVKVIAGNVVVKTQKSSLEISQGSSMTIESIPGGQEIITAITGSAKVTATVSGESTTVTPRSGPATVSTAGLASTPAAPVGTGYGSTAGTVYTTTAAPGTTSQATALELIVELAEDIQNEIEQQVNDAAVEAQTDSTVSATNTGDIEGVSQ